ncbi:integrase catalytic subunit [Actinoplanes sp. SE50]|nr:integrase catalytic region [Actinoplanes sp. SE50/110]ATO82856.1 integrase catalytic subunit [Actinoplanes sp. SE50]SLM00264.1 integrase [Actinoplanes sp. SE50/110]
MLVTVIGYSRWLTAMMIPTRQAPDLLAGHWWLLTGLGAVPKALVWDNEAAVGSWRAGRPQLTATARPEPVSAGIGAQRFR